MIEKIMVPVKRVVDYNVKIRLRSDGSGVELTNVKMSMNPFDEIALEEALRIKEKGQAGEVIVCSVGEQACQEILRKGLAMGADRAILVKHDGPMEPLGVAKILKAVVEREQPGLVLAGKQAIDDDCNQTAQMLSALLGWSQATFASSISIESNKLTVSREVDEGISTIAIALPAVVSVDLRLNEPRYTTMQNILKAKRKPLDEINSAELIGEYVPRLKVISTVEPPVRQAGVKVETTAELMDKLKEVGVI